MVAGRCCAPHAQRSFPFIEKVFADSGYAGEKVATATVIAVEIVRKSPDQVGFAVQPRRWVVERFFAWINRNRRLAKDFEATIASARAFLYAASVMLGRPQIGPSRMTFETDSYRPSRKPWRLPESVETWSQDPRELVRTLSIRRFVSDASSGQHRS